MAFNGFIKIRKGLLDHIHEHKMCPYDVGIYIFLHLHADSETGVYTGNASSIATSYATDARQVRKSLARLRERGYINYRCVKGVRGWFKVFINRYEPTCGDHVGFRLNAFSDNGLDNPVYDPAPCEGHDEATMRPRRGHDSEVSRPHYKNIDIRNKNIEDIIITAAAVEASMEDYEKIKICIQMWETIPGVKKPHVQKQYWKGEYPANSWFATLRTFVTQSDWKETWEQVIEEYKLSAFLRKGGFNGSLNSIGWVFQDGNANMSKVLNGNYRDKEPQNDQYFTQKDNLNPDGSMKEADIEKLREEAKNSKWKIIV